VICLDRVRMPISIPPKFSVSGVLGCLKDKSSLMIRQKRGNANSECRNREFWCRWHCIDVVGKNASKIAEYIRNQLKGDEATLQLSIDLEKDPFMDQTQSIRRASARSPAASRGSWWVFSGKKSPLERLFVVRGKTPDDGALFV